MAHSAGRTSSELSERRGMGLIRSLQVSRGARAFVGLRRNVHACGSNRGLGWCLFAPLVDEENHDGRAEQKIKNGHKPGDQAESGFRRLGVNGGTELLH